MSPSPSAARPRLPRLPLLKRSQPGQGFIPLGRKEVTGLCRNRGPRKGHLSPASPSCHDQHLTGAPQDRALASRENQVTGKHQVGFRSRTSGIAGRF